MSATIPHHIRKNMMISWMMCHVSRQRTYCIEKNISNLTFIHFQGIRGGFVRLHTVSFDWFLSGVEWILNLEFCLLKLLIFYQKLLWNIRSRLNSSTFWVFRPVFRYVWSKLNLCAQKWRFLNNFWKISKVLVSKTPS